MAKNQEVVPVEKKKATDNTVPAQKAHADASDRNAQDVYQKPDTPQAQDATAAQQARIANPAANQTFKVENANKPQQEIAGKVTKEKDGSYRVEAQDGNSYHAKTDKDGKMQSLQQIDKDTGKPIGEPMRVTSERTGLPNEIKKNGEINQPGQTTKHDSHEAKANEPKGTNPSEAKGNIDPKSANAQELKQQNEKAKPQDGGERGAAPRDGSDQKNQFDKGMTPPPSSESGKSQVRPDNIQTSLPPSSEKNREQQAQEQRRASDEAAAVRNILESQKNANESSFKMSQNYEQNRKTAEQFLARNTFDIPQRQQFNVETLQNNMKDADIKRLFEAAGEKSGTEGGASGRHTDVIDKMDNATSKADAAKFLDDKIGLLAAGNVNDRANRGADSKSGGGGGGGSSKGIEEGSKSTGAKSNDGKHSGGDRGVGTGGSQEGIGNTARAGKDILPTEPSGKLKAQIENVDKLPSQKSQLADMITKYSEGKFTPKGDKESALITAFQSVRFDQLKGIGAWLEDKTKNPFEFRMLDGQAQNAVSKIFEFVLNAADKQGARGQQSGDGKHSIQTQDDRAMPIRDGKIRDEKNVTDKQVDRTVKLADKSGKGDIAASTAGMLHALGERTVKLGGLTGRNDANSDRSNGTKIQIDRTIKMDSTGKSFGDKQINTNGNQFTVRLGTSDNATAKINDTRGDRIHNTQQPADKTVKVDVTAKVSGRGEFTGTAPNQIDRTAKADNTATVNAFAKPERTAHSAEDRTAKVAMDATQMQKNPSDAQQGKALGNDASKQGELRSQNPQVNDVVKRLVSEFRDENLSATITSKVADSSTKLKALKRKQPGDVETVPANEIVDEDSAKAELEGFMVHAPQLVLPSELAKDANDSSTTSMEEQIKLERKSPKHKTKGFTKTGTHRVLKDETFASIAKKYFDNESFAEIIFHYNKTASDIRPIIGKPGIALALPKVGSFLKIPNKTTVWQYKLASYDYSSYRFEQEHFSDATEELANTLGENWADRVELVANGTRIVESDKHAGLPCKSISLQLNHNDKWFTIYEYKIFDAETQILKHSPTGTVSKFTKSLPKKQSTEMALNHFRNNYEALAHEFAAMNRQ